MRHRTTNPSFFSNLSTYLMRLLVFIVDYALILVGPILSSIAWVVIVGVTILYFTEVLPSLQEDYGQFTSQFITALGLWILYNLVFNFAMTTMLGPGFVPDNIDPATKSMLADDPDRSGPNPRFCRTCDKVKPMRAHHCVICKKCVLKMDHHCPWVNTCVGWRNHKHFLLFLFYLFTGSGFFLTISFNNTVKALTGYPTTGYFLLGAVMCFSTVIASGFFLIWNIFLLVSNQSTIEFYTNYFGSPPRKSPFNLGVTRNIEEVFGTRSIFKILLPSRLPPAGDGLIFEVRDRGARNEV